MTTIVTRAGKGAPLTNAEVDANFNNLNNDKIEAGSTNTLTNKTINLASNTLQATSAQLAAAVTDETGTGKLVFATSPTLEGTPAAPTAAATTSTTQIATTAFVQNETAVIPTASKVVRARANGTIDPGWFPSELFTRENDIGVAGGPGFGVGVYPAALPSGLSALINNTNKLSDTYGNYQYTDGSICVYVPLYYYRIGSASSPRYATYGANAIDIAGVYDFATEAAANAAGYVLHRAFIDGGATKLGFFTDKYPNSKDLATGTTHGSSIQLRVPISLTTNSSYTRSQGMTGCTGILADAIVLSRARGSIWQCTSVFQYSALALLALAHAQASTSTTFCAWYNAAGTTNFPKGCNNNALGDVNDNTLVFTTAGDAGSANKPLAGSANQFSKTTHNGQNCGIADLNGTMWEMAIGVTKPGTSATDSSTGQGADLWMLKTSVAIRNLLSGWNVTDAAWQNSANIGTYYDQITGGMWWTDTNSYIYWGNSTNQVLDESASGLGYQRTSMLIPKDSNSASVSGTNLFGNDGLYRRHVANLALRVGGDWAASAAAGVFASSWDNSRSNTFSSISGFRASAYGA